MSFWKHRLNMRDLVMSIDSMSPVDLQKNLSKVKEEVAERLESASIFRQTNFPKRFRQDVTSVMEFKTAMEELYEFSDVEKVWIGL